MIGSVKDTEKKIVFNFLPKCGSTSVLSLLKELSPKLEFQPQWELIEYPERFEDFTIFSLIRHPVPYIVSGYRMFYNKGLQHTFRQHLEWINNPYELIIDKEGDWRDFWWHCGNTPDMYLQPNQKYFKLEELNTFETWISDVYETKVKLPHQNASEKIDVDLTDSVIQDLILRKSKYYADKYEYSFSEYF